jgi:hypothetical protein
MVATCGSSNAEKAMKKRLIESRIIVQAYSSTHGTGPSIAIFEL